MSTTQIIVTLIAVIVVAAIAAATWLAYRHYQLRQQFGPEYDRMVSERHGRFAAERELRARRRRHDELDLHDLTPEERSRYAAEWESVQARFVEDPVRSAMQAEDLVNRLAAARGYPTDDTDEELAQLSVDHPRSVDGFREAHKIAERGADGESNTEQLRNAVIQYRALVMDLLDIPAEQVNGAGAQRLDPSDVRPR